MPEEEYEEATPLFDNSDFEDENEDDESEDVEQTEDEVDETVEDEVEEEPVAQDEEEPASATTQYQRPQWTPTHGLTQAEYDEALTIGLDPDYVAFSQRVSSRIRGEERAAEMEAERARVAAGIPQTVSAQYRLGKNGIDPRNTMTPEGALGELLMQVGQEALDPNIGLAKAIEKLSSHLNPGKVVAPPQKKVAPTVRPMAAAARNAPKATSAGAAATPGKPVAMTDNVLDFLGLTAREKSHLKKTG